jgi:hypothetical protein
MDHQYQKGALRPNDNPKAWRVIKNDRFGEPFETDNRQPPYQRIPPLKMKIAQTAIS